MIDNIELFNLFYFLNLSKLNKYFVFLLLFFSPKSNELPNDVDDTRLLRARLRMNHDLRRDIHDKLQNLATDIKKVQNDLEKIEKNEGIISLNILRQFIDEFHFAAFSNMNDKDEVCL